MKIEVGRFYKTRDGRKVRIYAVDGEKDWPIHGAFIDGAHWIAETWSAKGYLNFRDESPLDIVSEWEEPGTMYGRPLLDNSFTNQSPKEKKPRIALPKFDDKKYAGYLYDKGMSKWLNEEVLPAIEKWLDEPEEE